RLGHAHRSELRLAEVPCVCGECPAGRVADYRTRLTVPRSRRARAGSHRYSRSDEAAAPVSFLTKGNRMSYDSILDSRYDNSDYEPPVEGVTYQTSNHLGRNMRYVRDTRDGN